MVKVSVIIPVYNVEQYLRECLDSVVNQTLKEIEIICVNDGSTDNSLAILEEYADKDERIKIISQENQGQSVARNVGLNFVKSDYVVFIDPDDYFSEKALEFLYLKIVETNDDLVISHCRAFPDNPEDRIQEEKARGFEKTLSPKTLESIKITEKNFSYYLNMLMVAVWGKIFSTAFLNNNGIKFLNENIVHEDDGFSTKVLASMPIISIIDKVTVMYRIREKSSTFELYSKSKKKHVNDMKKALNDAISFILKKYDNDLANKLIKKIKDSPKYSYFFYWNFIFLKLFWHKYDKKISLFFITLFRQKIKKGKLETKILGIPVLYANYKEDLI